MPILAETNAKPISIELSYTPLPKQAEWHGLSAKYRLFIGGWGNGKSSAGCAEAFILAMEYPGSTGLIMRKTRPELKATTEHQFFHGGGGNPKTDWTGCPEELIKKRNKSDNFVELINGSIIHFWPADDPDKLSNLNLGWFLIDQAEEVPEEIFQMLQGRLRQREAPRMGLLLANPAGHDWLWRRFVYLKYPDHKYVHAKTTDNPNLPKDYVDSLMKMPESWRKRFMDGSFDVFSGQIYPQFDPEVHMLNPFPIPDFWDGYEGIDWGYRNPTSVLWFKFDTIGNGFIVDEHLQASQLASYHANKILERRREWGTPVETKIDPSAAKIDPTSGRSVIDEFNDHGILVTPADNARIAGINRVAEWLREDPSHPHPLTGELHPLADHEDPAKRRGYPHLWIFKNVVQLPEHLQQYQWVKKPPTQETDAKEKPLEKDDHDVDVVRYVLMGRPLPSVMPDFTGEPQDRYWKLVRERMDRSMGGRGGKVHSMLGEEA
jgi:hypothetical protein